MSKKSIPNGDVEFVMMAQHYARTIGADPARFEIAPADAEALSEAVASYRQMFQAARSRSRTPAATAAKNQARAKAKDMVRHVRNLIKANKRIDAATKVILEIQPHKAKPKTLICPMEPPRLRFVRALHEGNAVPVHELKFSTLHFEQTKPPGAVRLELFVDLIPPDEPIPAQPGANHGSRPWYLRSYTKSPILLTPPMPRVQMRLVYWGRWADSMGNVGPFSATAVAWIEGNSQPMLPGGTGLALGGRKPVPTLEDARPVGPEGRNESYRVALLEVQIESYGVHANIALPEPAEQEMRQLEGPEKEAA